MAHEERSAPVLIGVGIDTVEILRFRELVDRRPGLINRVFTSNEKQDVGGRSDPMPGFAARFAAKEATMKALGVGLGAIGFSEIEILRSDSGKPDLKVTGSALSLATSLGVTSFLVSLTHTEHSASAVVYAQ